MQSSIETERVSFNPEHRRYFDTVTWLAEVLPGWMRTPFEYRFDGDELYASDNGPLGLIFDEAIDDSKNLPVFEQRRRLIEKEEYQQMLAMARGEVPNTMVVVSDFPEELMSAKQDMGGYNVTRKQTMLRVITKTSENTLKIYSQSLDGSNRKALEAIYNFFEQQAHPGELLSQRINVECDSYEQEFLIDQLTQVYDHSMQSQVGGEWFAGRPKPRGENTFDFVLKQTDLLNAYITTTNSFTGGIQDYNLAAAMKQRFTLEDSEVVNLIGGGVSAQYFALQEMQSAGYLSQNRGDVFSGCGASIGLSGFGQMSELGFGNKSEEDEYGSLTFNCEKGHTNTRPRGGLIEKCTTCDVSVKC